MLRFSIIGSGSKANAYIFEYNGSSFLVDNGYSMRELRRRMQALGYDEKNLRAIFLTHTHSDHLRGVSSLSRKLEIPVVKHYRLNLEKYESKPFYKILTVKPGEAYTSSTVSFVPFPLQHDAAYAIGYFLTAGGKSFTLITDTGAVNTEMLHYAAQCDVLFLEANYDVEMLRDGSYPEFLKRRISGNKGHLSNSDSVNFLNEVSKINTSLKQVYLCHLSENNNCPQQVEGIFRKKLHRPVDFRVCERNESIKGKVWKS